VASILIRKLPDSVKAKLKERATRHGHSMEEEARDILTRAAATQEESGRSLVDDIRDLFAPFGGVELPEVPDEPIPDPPDFS
jgi:antitoxin FitA